MLYDPEREKKQLFELGKPSLEALSYALRHPETWPDGFYWHFSECENCAMGLAASLWGKIRVGLNLVEPELTDEELNRRTVSDIARLFAMPYLKADAIFMGRGDWMPTKGHFFKSKDFNAVTPEMVADQIDKYLLET